MTTGRIVDVAYDVSTLGYSVAERESLIGIEITTLDGRLREPMIGVFVTCGHDGKKALLNAGAARDLAGLLCGMAERLEAGATSAGVQ